MDSPTGDLSLAVIPARGGSKRIPRKNVRDFAGRPLLAWAVDLAISSELFSHVVVSTDDDQIAEVALGAGAMVPFRRPASLSGDMTPTVDVMS
ncbi:MAG: pseudaminic acid cytidylyltransferase, partial [Myxococcales bacterium]|nr:pseudaminic acid cytidylyltransferase [Myxococcales bacterium]